VMSHNDQGTRVLVLVGMRTTMLSGHRSGYQQPRIPMAAVRRRYDPPTAAQPVEEGSWPPIPLTGYGAGCVDPPGPPGLQTSDSAS
jgi:hypothetical protein